MNVNFDKSENEFIPTIGRFIFDIAFIDEILTLVIKQNNEYQKNNKSVFNVNKSTFNNRVEHFFQIVCNFIDESKQNLESAKFNLIKLYKIRNLIAHNSLGITISYLNDGNLDFDIELIDKKNTKNTIDINYLNDLSKELRELRLEFINFYYKFHKKVSEKSLS